MTTWRFAFSRRWFGYLGMAVAFALACALLSHWQFDRTAETRAENLLVESNYSRDPLPIQEVLPSLDGWDDDLKWTPVVVTGTYLVDETLLVRNRPYNGRPGFEVLVPLLLDDGTALVVDRGWIPSGDSELAPDSIPAAPEGRVEVTARVRASEGSIFGRSAPDGQLASIELERAAEQIAVPIYTGAYGLLASESPEPAQARPLPAFKPDLNEGMHLSYAFQWIFFALLGFFGLGWALRQEFRYRNADDPAEQERAARRAEKLASKQANGNRSDADIEDELLDAK